MSHVKTKQKLFSDGEIVKVCLVVAAEAVWPNKDDIFGKMCLLRMTVTWKCTER